MIINQTRIGRVSIQLGFWSALLSAVAFLIFTVCFITLLTVNPIFMWTNMDDFMAYAREHHSILPDVARLTVLLFGSLYIVLLNSIHEYARDEHKVLVRISLCFGVAFAVLTGAHYFVQLSAIRLNLLHDNLEGLEQVVQANPYSAMSAINMLGWTIFLGLSSLFAAPVFSGSGLEKVIRIAFVLNGIFCLLGGIGYVFEIVALVFLTINLGMGGMVMLITIALCMLFKRIDPASHLR